MLSQELYLQKKNGLKCIGINNSKIKGRSDFYFKNFSILTKKFI